MRLFKQKPEKRYYVDVLTRSEALDQLKGHPLKRDPKISYAFGLIDKRSPGRKIVAAMTFGSPSSPSIPKGLVGYESRLEVIELNRIRIDQGVKGDAVEFFLKAALMLVQKKFIITYVKPIIGEQFFAVLKKVGFYYLGLTTPHMDPAPIGDAAGKHNRHAHYGLSKVNKVPRPRKHRFVFLNTADAQEKKDLFSQLRYEVLYY